MSIYGAANGFLGFLCAFNGHRVAISGHAAHASCAEARHSSKCVALCGAEDCGAAPPPN